MLKSTKTNGNHYNETYNIKDLPAPKNTSRFEYLTNI
jgi:hypothetical protein